MRKVAPDRPGTAASQNSWFVLYLKPIDGRLTTTTLHTIQIANASISAGIEIQRLRLAVGLPRLCQNAGTSGSQVEMR